MGNTLGSRAAPTKDTKTLSPGFSGIEVPFSVSVVVIVLRRYEPKVVLLRLVLAGY